MAAGVGAGRARPMPLSARVATERLGFVSLGEIVGRQSVPVRRAQRHRTDASSLEKSCTHVILPSRLLIERTGRGKPSPSAANPELMAAGHEVSGLARSDASADALRSAGVEVRRGNLDDLDALRHDRANAAVPCGMCGVVVVDGPGLLAGQPGRRCASASRLAVRRGNRR